MAKKELTAEEQLQAKLAAAQAAQKAAEEKAASAEEKAAELEKVVDEQTAALESESDAKKAGVPVITVGKKKYKVLVPKCQVAVGATKNSKGKLVGGQLQTVVTAELGKKENKEVFDALMALDGQCVLEELTA